MMTRAAVAMIAALVCCTAVSLSAHKTVVSTFTYYRDIRPLFERSCASCHDPNGAPPALLRYDSAVASYPAIERVLLGQARPEHGSQLTHIEFDRVMTWAAGGTPEGDRPANAPVPAPKRHAAHAGQLGGLMAAIAGDSMHAELVFAEQRRLRAFITTTSGDPAPLDRLRALRLSVKTPDGAETPFTLSRNGDALEARIPTVVLPVTFVLIDRDANAPPTSLQFSSYSVDPPELAIPPTEIPAAVPEVIAAIERHASVALALAAESRFGQLYVPTTHVRNLLVAINPGDANVDRALREMMRANWALHLAGDNGFSGDVRRAADQFKAAVAAITAASAK